MLNYEREVPGLRDTTELFARGRPTVEYRDAGQPDQEPYIIIGNQVRLRGNDQAWAGGSVTIDRSDFHAKGDSAELDLGADRGDLLGHARVEGGDSAAFVVGGNEVGFTLEDGALNWVQARASAEAESADWRLVAASARTRRLSWLPRMRRSRRARPAGEGQAEKLPRCSPRSHAIR